MSSSIAKIRILLETIRHIAVHLNDEEIEDIGIILNRALNRLESESNE